MVDREMMDRVLDEFGSPSEVAREYSGVARTAVGRGLKAFMVLEAVFAVMMGIIGMLLIWQQVENSSRGWYDSFGFIWGTFWLLLMSVTLAAIWLQSRKAERIPELGPFTLVVLLGFGLLGLCILATFRWQVYWIFGIEDMGQQNLLLAALTVTFVTVAFWGAVQLWRFTRELRNRERDGLIPRRKRFSRGSKRFIAITSILLVSVFVSGNLNWLYYPIPSDMPSKGDERVIRSENIGGPYNATIQKTDYFDGEMWQDTNKIIYNVSGEHFDGWFGLETVKAMDWMKNNTPGNATIVAWWDHGISIRGYTGRNCTIYYPSKNLIHTVWDPTTIKGWEPQEKVRRTADVYMAENGTELLARMDAVGARYIFLTWRYSSSIAYAIIQGAGADPDRYLDTDFTRTQGRYLPSEAGEKLFLFKIWKGDFEGARIVYQDIDNLVVAVD